MSENKHTPGPWSVGHTRPVKWGFKNEYTNWSVPVHCGPFETRGNSLADVHSGGPGALHPSDREAVEANARLIAAAPELLEALQALWTASVGVSDEEITARLRARLAIAKATGEAVPSSFGR